MQPAPPAGPFRHLTYLTSRLIASGIAFRTAAA